MLTMACGLAVAADPPAKPPLAIDVALPAALAEGIKIKLPEGINVNSTDQRNFSFYVGFERDATDSKAKSNRASTKPAPKTTAASADPFDPAATSKRKKAATANTPKPNGPGYTQAGQHITLKLDRPKTELSLSEDFDYVFYAKGAFVRLISPDKRLIEIVRAKDGCFSIRTLKPGVATLEFLRKEEFLVKETENKRYRIEITILGDTHKLQSRLDKLHPR
jgi:hypothetical protein